MKPNELRAKVKARDQAKAVRGDKLEAFLKTGEPQDKPSPDLVPDEADKTRCLREYRRLARLAAGERRGSEKYGHLLGMAAVELARLVYIERVLDLHPLDRAALTPVRLTMLSVVSPEEIRGRLDALQGLSTSEVTW